MPTGARGEESSEEQQVMLFVLASTKVQSSAHGSSVNIWGLGEWRK